MLQALSVTAIEDAGAEELRVVTSNGDHYEARAVLIATGLVLPAHRRRGRGRPDRRGHPLLRHVRRPVLQGLGGADGARRRQQRPRGGALPHAVHRQGDGRRVQGPSRRQPGAPGQGRAPTRRWTCCSSGRSRRSRRRTTAAARSAPSMLENVATGETRGAPSRRACSCSSGSIRTPSFLKGIVDLDERGFVATDPTFMTSLPGVFAAGDVRDGSTKQLASAVGEGAAVAIQIRGYLDRQLERGRPPGRSEHGSRRRSSS